jgi:hypothetical protein
VLLAISGAGPFAVLAPPIAVAFARGVAYVLAAPTNGLSWPSVEEVRTASRRFIKPAIAAYLGSVTFLADSLILGTIVTARAMGLYAFSFNLAVQTTLVIAVAVASTVQPIFAAMGSDRQRQAEGLLRTVRLVSVIAVPAAAIQAAFCELGFSAIWGDKWNAAVPVFMVLSIGQALVFATTPSIFLLKAQGRFGTYLSLAAIQLSFAVVTTFAAATFGGPPIIKTAGIFGVGIEPDAATPLAVACTTALGWATFGPLAMRLACQQTTIGWRAAIGVTLKPWIIAAPIALFGALATSLVLRVTDSRPSRITIVFGFATLTFAVSLIVASRLYATTKSDLSMLFVKLARGLKL